MKLTFLGTGTSTGVPSIGCSCATCRSADPRDKRLRASALIQSETTSLLIDSGPDFRQQILRLGSPALDALLITHHHYDHVGGIDDLRPYCYPYGFDVYCDKDTDRAIRHNFPYCFAKKHYPGAPVFNTNIITPYKQFSVGDIDVLPLSVNHYLIEILGFRIGNLAYITDAKHIPEATIDAIRGIDTLVINALRHKEHLSHMNLNEALDVINNIKPRVAYLTHMSHDIGKHGNLEASLPPHARPAFDGLTIDF